MDIDKIKRRQSLKVIISEIIMVTAVAVTVVILALVVSGYWLSSDLTVERHGMLQISSIPSGADLVIDGESSWFQRTNTSKVLSSGEHVISLSKEGYDTWSRVINISEGLLYRVHYPRLFLKERESKKVFEASKYTSATVSPDKKSLLLMNSTTEWAFLSLEDETIEATKVNIAPYFSSVSLAEQATIGLFTGEIVSSNWDSSSEHILFEVKKDDALEWVLLDISNLKNSINLTKEFGVNFDLAQIFDNSASALLTIENGNLRKIDTKNKTISAPLVDHVYDFDFYENEIIFSALMSDETYQIGLLKGNSEKTELEVMKKPAKLAIFQFYDDKYIATLVENVLTLHQKDDYKKTTSFNLQFIPNDLTVGANGEFITMFSDVIIASLNMEDSNVRDWSVEGQSFGWLDDNMIYTVKNGELIVYDFDGLNRRVLSENVSSHFPVTITNNKWLYYFSDGALTRETITNN